MAVRKWRIGDVVPLEPSAPVQGGPLSAPQWFAFITPPRKEAAARAWLRQRGVADSWHPTETRWRRIPRSRAKGREYEASIVPRYIFVRFTGEPRWAALQECRWLTRVIGIQGKPLPISDQTMAQMAEVPARLAAIRKREQEARIVRPGDRARIRDGSMAGWVIEIADVHAGIARFIAPLLGEREVEISLERIEKLPGVVR